MLSFVKLNVKLKVEIQLVLFICDFFSTYNYSNSHLIDNIISNF